MILVSNGLISSSGENSPFLIRHKSAKGTKINRELFCLDFKLQWNSSRKVESATQRPGSLPFWSSRLKQDFVKFWTPFLLGHPITAWAIITNWQCWFKWLQVWADYGCFLFHYYPFINQCFLLKSQKYANTSQVHSLYDFQRGCKMTSPQSHGHPAIRNQTTLPHYLVKISKSCDLT